MRLSKNTGTLLVAFTLYVVFFLLLFIQFPLNGSLPGQIDSWWYLGVFNDYANDLRSLAGDINAGTALYPEMDVSASGEPAYGGAALFLLYKLIGVSDIWSLCLLLITVYSTSAFACFLVSRHFIKSFYARLFAGLVFAASGFSLGHIDDQKVFFFFWGLMALNSLINYHKYNKSLDLILLFVLLGIQLYFSSYAFLFSAIIISVYWLFHIRSIRLLRWQLVPALLLFSILVSPFVYRYALMGVMDAFHNPIDIFSVGVVSLDPGDFWQKLPNNLIYGSSFYDNPSWVYQMHCAWPGILVIFLVFVGIVSFSTNRRFLVAVFVSGLLIAFGPFLSFGSLSIPMPMYWVYKYIGPAEFLRIPVRAYLMSIFVLAIFAGRGLEWLMLKWEKPTLLFLLTSIILFLENVPAEFQKYPASKFLNPPAAYLDFLDNKDKLQILEMPTLLFDQEFDYDLSAPSREYIYVYWQTMHKHNILNGMGYIPYTRLQNQEWIDQITQNGMLDSLIINNDLDLITWHPDMIIGYENYDDELKFLKASPRLNKVIEQENLIVFEVLKNDYDSAIRNRNIIIQ